MPFLFLFVAITSGPKGLTNDSNIVFEFTTQNNDTAGASQSVLICRSLTCNMAEDFVHCPCNAGIEFECKLGDSNGNITAPQDHDWTNCTSPVTYAGLPDGAYQFAVRGQVRMLPAAGGSRPATWQTAAGAVCVCTHVPPSTFAQDGDIATTQKFVKDSTPPVGVFRASRDPLIACMRAPDSIPTCQAEA